MGAQVSFWASGEDTPEGLKGGHMRLIRESVYSQVGGGANKEIRGVSTKGTPQIE